uniref:Uncharacterized protein n=1 Tax=Lygus hesperus TaxID=30085 RepID=A0A0A9Y282_LYGHE
MNTISNNENHLQRAKLMQQYLNSAAVTRNNMHAKTNSNSSTSHMPYALLTGDGAHRYTQETMHRQQQHEQQQQNPYNTNIASSFIASGSGKALRTDYNMSSIAVPTRSVFLSEQMQQLQL